MICCVPAVAGFSFSPDDGIAGGSGSDGSGTSGIPGSGSGLFSEVVWECNNSGDDDGDGRIDMGALSSAGDSGCVKPAILDRNEGNTWDSDLTSTYLDIQESGSLPEISEDPTVFFDGDLRYTGREGRPDSTQDSASDGTLTEQYLADAKDESKKYGKGVPGTGENDQNGKTHGLAGGISERDLVSGTVLKQGGRVVDPPTDAEGVAVAGSRDTCGDGKINDGFTPPSEVALSPEKQESGCREDYGTIESKRSVRPTPSQYDWIYKTGGESAPPCRNDVVESEETESGGTSYDVVRTFYQDENNGYWTMSGDTLTGKACNAVPGASVAGGKGTVRNYDTVNPPAPSVDCNRFNRVDGGGDVQYRAKPDNDAAATFTDYTAYGDNSKDKVWCQFEETLTVDADGPQGRGDGFVLINASSGTVAGSESPDGSDSVGKNIYFRSSTTGNDGSLQRSSLSKRNFPKTCPGEKKYCIKYIDYLTERDALGWESRNNNIQPTDSQIAEAVRSKVSKVMTADESYSVCKKINQLAGPGEVVDCDYEVDGEDVSPLPEACGDQPEETLVVFEGPQVNPSNNEFLAYNQRCMDYSSDGDIGIYGGPVSPSYCLYKGQFFPPGSMIDISSDYSGAEVDGGSPDLEVCLDAPQSRSFKLVDNVDNDPDKRDFGGEWYDLDNDNISEMTSGAAGGPLLPLFKRNNPNPHHPVYNPTGGESGFALEDDCGNQRFGTNLECEDTDESTSRYYTFFSKKVELSP